MAEWNCPQVPQGGVVTGVIAEALTQALDRADQPLRSIQVVFAGPVAEGPAEIDVWTLRQGRSMSQMRAEIRSKGTDVGAHALAVFGAARQGDDFQLAEPPVLRSPEKCWSWNDLAQPDVGGRVQFAYWRHADRRSPYGVPPWLPPPGGIRENLCWFRYEEAPLRADGSWEPTAVAAMCDMMPGAVFEFLGDKAGTLYGPSADLTVHLFGPARGEWLAARNRCRVSLDGYASLEMELWSGDALVAYATQVMYFVYPKFFTHDDADRAAFRAALLRQNEELAARWPSPD